MDNFVIEKVLKEYKRLEEQHTDDAVTWIDMQEDEIWIQICFCILSSNVRFEMAYSATRHLMDCGLIERRRLTLLPEVSISQIACELSKPYYLPLRKDRTRRRYRFPNSRADHIVQTALHLQGTQITDVLHHCETDYQAREFLARRIHGMGLKESSMFLRNIRYSNGLAVIDFHVLHFLKKSGLIGHSNYRIQERKTYLYLETLLRNFALDKRLDMSILDLAIWKSVREGYV